MDTAKDMCFDAVLIAYYARNVNSQTSCVYPVHEKKEFFFSSTYIHKHMYAQRVCPTEEVKSSVETND